MLSESLIVVNVALASGFIIGVAGIANYGFGRHDAYKKEVRVRNGYKKRLAGYVISALSKGYGDEQIKARLRDSGVSEVWSDNFFKKIETRRINGVAGLLRKYDLTNKFVVEKLYDGLVINGYSPEFARDALEKAITQR